MAALIFKCIQSHGEKVKDNNLKKEGEVDILGVCGPMDTFYIT